MNELVHPEESYAIIGACFEVYNEKGSGFLEPIYQDCLELELGLKKIPFTREPQLPLAYKGIALRRAYSPDFVCYGKVIVELKACDRMADEHVAQVLNYLNATGFELGLLINFGAHPKLEYRRIVRTRKSSAGFASIRVISGQSSPS